MGCPAPSCSAAAPLSGAVTGEPAVGSAAPALRDPTFTGESLRDRGSDRSPCFYGEGENEVRSETSLGAGGKDRGGMEPGGLRGPGKPSSQGSDTRHGQRPAPRGGAKSGGWDPGGQNRAGAAGTPCSGSGGLPVFAGRGTDPLTTNVSSLAHRSPSPPAPTPRAGPLPVSRRGSVRSSSNPFPVGQAVPLLLARSVGFKHSQWFLRGPGPQPGLLPLPVQN